MKKFILVLCISILSIASAYSYAEKIDYPKSNVSALHASEVVVIGSVEYVSENLQKMEEYNENGDITLQEKLITHLKFEVTDNLGNENLIHGSVLNIEISNEDLDKLYHDSHGSLLLQKGEVLLGFEALDSDEEGNPLSYSILSSEFIPATNQEQALKEMVSSIQGADTPELNTLIKEEWEKNGSFSEYYADALDDAYEDSLTANIDEEQPAEEVSSFDNIETSSKPLPITADIASQQQHHKRPTISDKTSIGPFASSQLSATTNVRSDNPSSLPHNASWSVQTKLLIMLLFCIAFFAIFKLNIGRN